MSWEASKRYWFQFTRNFRSGSLWRVDDTFVQLKNTLCSTEKELLPVKIHLLSFLQQNASLLLPDTDKVQDMLSFLQQELLELPCSNTLQIHLVEQVMVTTTCLFIDLDESLFSSVPRFLLLEEYVNTLMHILRGSLNTPNYNELDDTSSLRDFGQSFERGLVEVAGKTGIHIGGLDSKAQERTLRLYAAESLREIEETFPTILASLFPEIMILSQQECTHASQSYILLVTSIANHLPPPKDTKISPNSAAAFTENEKRRKEILSRDYIPSRFKVVNPKLVDANFEIEVGDSYFVQPFQGAITDEDMQYILSKLSCCTSWGAMDLVPQVISLIEKRNISLLQHFDLLFLRFQRSYFLPFLQSFILVYLSFPNLFHQHNDAIRKQVEWYVNPLSASSPSEKALVLMWYGEIYDFLYEDKIIAYDIIKIHSFDTIATRIRKLFFHFQLLYKEYNRDNEMVLDYHSLDILHHIRAFRYFPSSHFTVEGLVHIFLFLLRRIPPLYPAIYNYLLHELKETPRFSKAIITILSAEKDNKVPETVKLALLRSTYDFLCNDNLVDDIAPYIKLLGYLLVEKYLNPSRLILQLLRMLECMEMDLSWSLSNDLLALCRNVIVVHETQKIYGSMCKVLEFLSLFAVFLDVRERASFLLQLFTRVPRDVLLTILSHESIGGIETSLNNPPPFEEEEEDAPDSKDIPLHYITCSISSKFSLPVVIPWYVNEMEVNEWKQNSDDWLASAWASYSQCIRSRDFSVEITIPLEISMPAEDNPNNSAIFSVTFSLRPSHPDATILYEPFPIIHVPVLSDHRNAYYSKVQCSVIQPIPVPLSVTVTYQDSDANFYEKIIDDVELLLDHLLIPICFPVDSLISIKDVSGFFFLSLWDVDLLASKDGAESIKVIDIKSREETEKLLQENFSLSRLQLLFDQRENETEFHFLSFLPPHYHLALKVLVRESTCRFEVKTDFWPLLSYIDAWLDSVFQDPTS